MDGHDAEHWDRRYSQREPVWSVHPNATVETMLAEVEPGRALDLAAGEGRHAVWLARLGWVTTAVDFSAVGVERGRQIAERLGIEVTWVVADATTWRPAQDAAYDLVLVAFFHLDQDVFDRVATWVAPGGRLVVVGHALRNLTAGVGGPTDPRILYTEDTLRAAAADLTVERLEEVERVTPQGTAIDLVLLARATGHDTEGTTMTG